MWWCYLHSHATNLHEQHALTHFLHFCQWHMYCWYLYFSVQTLFFVVVSSIGRCSLQYVWYFSFSILWWTSICLLMHIGVVNQRLSQLFWKFIKISSTLRKYFIAKCVFTSVHATKKKNFDGPPGGSTGTLQNILGLITAIMTECIVVVDLPPLFVMIRDNFRIIELGYPPHSPPLSLPSGPLPQSNLKRLASS